VPLFQDLWRNHVGRGYVCDQDEFGNQCAMRLGQAVEASGVSLASERLKRCTGYSPKFKDHVPGHIRSAQDLANVFYWKPSILGAGVKKRISKGSMDDNFDAFNRKQGIVFIMNGWGTTDHIDLWDGLTLQMKGASSSEGYRQVGREVWFWEL